MSEKTHFKCTHCEGLATLEKGKAAPECCGEPMITAEPMDQCTVTSTAEHSRFDETQEPCDDGRAG